MSFLVKHLSEGGELLSALQGGRAGCHGTEVEGEEKQRKSWQDRKGHREIDLGEFWIILDGGNCGVTLEN